MSTHTHTHEALRRDGSLGMGSLADFMFEYGGVLEIRETGAPEAAPPMQLLLLRNLRDGCRNFRMLDIKALWGQGQAPRLASIAPPS